MKPRINWIPVAAITLLSSLAAQADQIVIGEIMYNPPGTKPEFIEVRNVSYTPRDMALWKFSSGVNYQFPDYTSGTSHLLLANEKIIISSADPATTRAAYGISAATRVFGPWTGSLDNSGERISLDDKNGVTQATVKYSNSGRWPKAADGLGHSLVLINQNCDADDWHNWKASPTSKGSAGASTVVANYADTWQWNIPTSDPGTGWRTATSGWATGASGSGPGLLGFESAQIGGPGMQLPALASGSVTYLFRKTFTYSGSTSGASVSIDQFVDDGVIYYLNGNQIGLSRMDNGTAWNANALPQIGDAAEEVGAISGPATGLVVGNNVLCAEVHNGGPGSSDLVFGAKMTITAGGGAASSATLRLSEVHFNGAGAVDWVEIQNYTGTTQSAAGLFLSSKSDFSDKVALSGNVNGNAFQSFTVNFAADVSGSVKIFLTDGANNIFGAETLTHLAGRDSIQAIWPANPVSKPTWELLRRDEEWYSSTTSTQNAANNPTMTTSIVINEIMCDPMSEQESGEFLELFNKSGSPVTLTGWKLRGGVDFDFPAGTTIAANGYLIVGGNKAFLQTIYSGVTIVGDWSGKLGNKGDYLRLVDQFDNLADEVDYKTGGNWPDFSANKGSSMELINPNMDNNRASAWRASDESNKSTFGTYSVTGTYDEIFSAVPWANATLQSFAQPSDYKELFFQAAKESHFILRNISLTPQGGGGNLLQNVGQKSTNGNSNNGWLCQGTHAESYFDGSGYFHIVSDGHGDQRPNHCEVDCTGINAGSSYTLSFEARWVSGTPRLVGVLWTHSMGKAFLIDVPNNLGTAGAQNSRFNGTTPPQVDSVIHSPAVPKSSDTVKVTARVYSQAGISNVEVFHRTDNTGTGYNTNNYSSQQMFDNGTNGDALANDGVYTANITSHQSDGQLVQFYVKATGNGQTAMDPLTGHLRPAMWAVDNRTIPNDLRRQRFIISAYDLEMMKSTPFGSSPGGAARPENGYKYGRLSNHYFPMTFIHNESDVYYLCEMHEGGSRWHRTPEAKMEAAKWKVPGDRLFRKHDKSSYDHDLDYGADYYHGQPYLQVGGVNSRTVGYLLYLMGYPATNEEEFAYTLLNDQDSSYPGLQIRTDNELTDNDLVNRSYKDGGSGELYEVLEEWWYRDDYGDLFRMSDWVYKGTDESVRYMQEYPLRMREGDWNYGPLTNMFKLVCDPNTSREVLERTMDTESMMREAAIRAVCGDWDSLYSNGKNGMLYHRPSDGKMISLNWDNDAAFSPNDGANAVIGGQDSPTPGAPNVPSYGGATLRPKYGMYINKPWVRRVFNYFLTESIDGYCSGSNARTATWIDAQRTSIQSAINYRNGLYDPDQTVTSAFYQEWFQRRRQDVLDAINQNAGTGGAGNAYNAAFAVTSPGSGGSTGSAVVNITGTAPSKAYSITVDNHPEAVLTWSNQVNWSLNGIVLKTGSNTLTLHMVNVFGAQVGSAITWTITKSGNAAPVMDLNVDPSSYNATLGQIVALDASASADPDGGALTFSWSNTPGSGVTVTTPTATPANSARQAVFTTPGIYSFTVTGTDPSSGATALTREIAAANIEDFASFSATTLESYWTVANMENKDNFSGSKWYSLYAKPGALTIEVLDSSAKPIAYAGANHPTLLRNMPASADCAILTEVNVEGRTIGTFSTGLYLETNEGEGVVRYAFGLEDGTHISAKRMTSGGISSIAGSPLASTGADAKLRIRRVGTQLRFERRTDGVWSTLFTQGMSGAQTLSKGGVFLATAQAETERVSFDYVTVVDPSNVASSALSSLKITEVMYNPLSPDTVEYIELKNTGASTININGVHFEDGNPVTGMTFGNVSLTAGQYIIATNSSSAFTAKYGSIANVSVVQWTSGSLSNGGEKIKLLDVDNNLIHNFDYKTVAPWPVTADGTGPSMQVINVGGDYDDGTNWTAGAASPGTAGSGPDSDGDGMSDAAEAKFGTNPNSPGSRAVVSPTRNGSNQAVLGWPTVNGQQYRVEYCDILGGAWQTLSTITANGASWNFTDTTSPVPAKRFYRIVAL